MKKEKKSQEKRAELRKSGALAVGLPRRAIPISRSSATSTTAHLPACLPRLLASFSPWLHHHHDPIMRLCTRYPVNGHIRQPRRTWMDQLMLCTTRAIRSHSSRNCLQVGSRSSHLFSCHSIDTIVSECHNAHVSCQTRTSARGLFSLCLTSTGVSIICSFFLSTNLLLLPHLMHS